MDAKHRFEEAGLGRAPFVCVGVTHRVGPIDLGGGCTVGAPGQPMGTCDYCGTGIAYCYAIRSSDGRQFVVGSECVRHTGDRGLIAQVDEGKRRVAREKAWSKSRVIYDEGLALLADPAVRAALASKPHPQPWARDKGMTLLDSCEWTWENAGANGRAAAITTMRKAAIAAQEVQA